MNNHRICGFCLFVISQLASADPVNLQTVAGSMVSDSVLTLRGVGMGHKGQSAPLAWETFESGRFLAYWSDTTGLSVVGREPRTPRSKRAAYHDFNSSGSAAIHSGYLTGSNRILASTWMLSYWVYLAPNFDWQYGGYPNPQKFLSNIKIFRLWNPGPTREDFLVNTHGWEKSVVWQVENTVSAHSTGYCLQDYGTKSLAPGRWHHLQLAYRENSALGAADGSFRLWADGRLAAGSDQLTTRLKDDVLKRPAIVGFYNSWSPGEGVPDSSDMAPNEMYLDDTYVDSSWARVEVGNRSNYDSCTHREMQIPSDWSDSVVTVTANQGAFAVGDSGYVFVVHSSGSVSRGFPVKWSEPSAAVHAATAPAIIWDRDDASFTIRLSGSALGSARLVVHRLDGQLVEVVNMAADGHSMGKAKWLYDGRHGLFLVGLDGVPSASRRISSRLVFVP